MNRTRPNQLNATQSTPSRPINEHPDKAEKAAQKPKRPLSAFLRFRSDLSKIQKITIKQAAHQWRSLSERHKQRYRQLCQAEWNECKHPGGENEPGAKQKPTSKPVPIKKQGAFTKQDASIKSVSQRPASRQDQVREQKPANQSAPTCEQLHRTEVKKFICQRIPRTRILRNVPAAPIRLRLL